MISPEATNDTVHEATGKTDIIERIHRIGLQMLL